jgi:hypothetical protein
MQGINTIGRGAGGSAYWRQKPAPPQRQLDPLDQQLWDAFAEVIHMQATRTEYITQRCKADAGTFR